MKKLTALVLTALFLVLVCVLSLVGCSQQQNTSEENSNEQINSEPNESSVSSTQINSEPNEPNESSQASVYVVEIWDRSIREGLAVATAEEKFWEDETNEYYFPNIISHHVMVEDNTGRTVDVKTALEEGLITVEDLDTYGIGYFAEPKNKTVSNT